MTVACVAVKIPHSRSRRRILVFTLLLVAALVMLVVTGLGVFRLHVDAHWNADQSTVGELFSLTVTGGRTFAFTEAEPFGQLFWISRLLTLALALALPWLRILPASGLAILAVLALLGMHFQAGEAVPRIPIEFELLIVGVLYALYVVVSYAAEVRDRKRFASLLSQYVPPELASAYSRYPESMGLSGEEREITVLFCDIVGFSAVAETLEPPQVAEWLNGFFGLVSRIVVRHRGTIDKLMGDSVMAVWGAPARSQTHAFDALSAALDIQRELAVLNADYAERTLPAIQLGLGLSTGRANVGPLGSEYRMDYTVVGDTVNIAQRLEAQTRKYQVPVIVSDKTAEALPDVLFRELDTVMVKGRSTPVTMFQPLGLAADLDEQALTHLQQHKDAMQASKRGEWARARELFESLRDGPGPKPMYELYLRGIEQASGQGPG